MALPFFQNGLNNGAIQMPNDYFRDQQQAAIDQQWDCTSARYTIKEQSDFGSDVYNDIEVWIDYVVGLGNRGTTNGDDFRQLLFRDINYQVRRGLYYQFDGNYWITYFSDEYASLSKDAGVRRCNNVMRIVDPENGSIFSIPCVVDYDMTSPSQQVSSYIITPNNHATIMVQGNADTLRLFKLNTRYILGGRPFKLLAYQNALIDQSIASTPTLLYLDLYLDEIHAQDDIENQLAYNGSYQYTIDIDSTDMELTNGTTGTLTASIALNGEEVNREVVWKSASSNIVSIDEEGNYQVVGSNGQSSVITAILLGNPLVEDSIQISVVDDNLIVPKILIEPTFDSVRQFETIDFAVKVAYGSQITSPEMSSVSLSPDSEVLTNQYVSIEKNQDSYRITGLEIALEPVTLYVSVQNSSPEFESQSQFEVKATSFLGQEVQIVYNSMNMLPYIPYKILTYLALEDETLWKLLAYNDYDALSKPNLTFQEKMALIWKKNEPQVNYSVFMTNLVEDAIAESKCILKLYNFYIHANQLYTGTVVYGFDFLYGGKMSLVEYNGVPVSRGDLFINRILEVLNGVEVGGVGKLTFFDDMSRYDLARSVIGNSKTFTGVQLFLSVNVGDVGKDEGCVS